MTSARTLAESPAGGPVPHLELVEWREQHGLVAGITTRDGDFDLGLFGPGRASRVLGNWLTLQQAFDRRFPGIAVGQQVHGNVVQFHETLVAGWRVADRVDGHATRERGVLLTVTVADCVPVYLAHPGTRTLALLHAGWRGVAAGILEAGVAVTTSRSNAPAAELVMHCGISICGECYEVGPEVFRALGIPRDTHVDLRAELNRRALVLGVRDVTTSPWCSAHDAGRFYSHRRSGGADGRMLAFLGTPAA